MTDLFIGRQEELKTLSKLLHKQSSSLVVIQGQPPLPKGYSCRPVLIHVNGVHEDVIDSGFFINIIDFGKYLDN